MANASRGGGGGHNAAAELVAADTLERGDTGALSDWLQTAQVVPREAIAQRPIGLAVSGDDGSANWCWPNVTPGCASSRSARRRSRWWPVTDDRAWNVWEVIQDARRRAEDSGHRVIPGLGQEPYGSTPTVQGRWRQQRTHRVPPAHGTETLRGLTPTGCTTAAPARRWIRPMWSPRSGAGEFIATVPWLLGLGPSDTVVVPELATPRTRRALRRRAADYWPPTPPSPSDRPRCRSATNTPSNPTGRSSPREHWPKSWTGPGRAERS